MRSVIWEDDRVTNIAQQLITNRGFTGHEHIEEVGLIHMNGRVYDQELGRFLSADPLIQAPFVTNSFNRYSYVMNNPLKYTDPTGFSGYEGGACTADNPDSQACKTPSSPSNGGEHKGGATGSSGETKTTETEDQNLTEDQLHEWLHERFGDQSINSVPVTPIGFTTNMYAMFAKDVSTNLSPSTEFSISSVVSAVGNAAVNVVQKKVKVASVLDKITKRNPNDIKLSHPANLSKEFSDPRNGTVGDLAKKLKEDPSLANRISPIEVAKIKGKTYSANNRRLRAFQEAKVDVNTIPASKEQVRKIKQGLQNKRK